MKTLLSLFLLLSASLSAAPIHSYPELAQALRAGKRFTIVVDHPHGCGYFAPTGMVLVSACEDSLEHIATSHLHFSDYPGYPIYEYVKYTFNSDNSVVVNLAMYHPQNFTLIGEPFTLKSAIGHGVQIHTEEVKP